MATKRKTGSKSTKADLEVKIAKLEAKLSKLSEQLDVPAPEPAQTKPAEPKPAPRQEGARPAQTRPAEPKPAPKPAKPAGQKPGVPASMADALEHAYQNAPMTDTHSYKQKTPGYSPAPNRYYVRKTAPTGTVPTENWNMQKSRVPGYTQPSNQYFATRARLAYHPPTKTFTGYGMKVDESAPAAQAAPPPPEKPGTAKRTLPKGMEAPPARQNAQDDGGSKKEQLEAYEKEYLERRERESKERDEIQRAAEELAAKRMNSSGQTGRPKGTLPKGF